MCVQRLLEEDQVERSHQQENEVLEKTLALNEKVTAHMPEVYYVHSISSPVDVKVYSI